MRRSLRFSESFARLPALPGPNSELLSCDINHNPTSLGRNEGPNSSPIRGYVVHILDRVSVRLTSEGSFINAPHIIGWGHTIFGKRDMVELEELIREAALPALENANVQPDDIDGIFVG